MAPSPRPIMNLVNADRVDPRKYNPTRDIALVFPQVIAGVVDSIQRHADGSSPDSNVARQEAATGVTMPAVADVFYRLQQFCVVVAQGNPDDLPPWEIAKLAGLDDTDPVAFNFAFARIGQAFLALFAHMYVEANTNSKPLLTEADLRRAMGGFLARHYAGGKDRSP